MKKLMLTCLIMTGMGLSVSADVQIDPEMIKQIEEAQKKKEAESLASKKDTADKAAATEASPEKDVTDKKDTADKADSKAAASKESDDSGGSLGGLEVISLLTLAGGAVYMTRKREV